MPAQTFIAALLFAVTGATFAGEKPDHAHGHKPMHGGVVVGTAAMDFELVAKADVITLHLRDHGKAVDLKGASGKLTILSGHDKSEALLSPAGGGGLQARGDFKLGAGTKMVATVTLVGKPTMNVRFVLK